MKKSRSNHQKEKWLYRNPKALKSIMKGVKDAQEGKIREFDVSELCSDHNFIKDG